MVDVIEHIPEAERPAVFRDLASVSADDATLCLTYPSPEYQRWLMAEQPDELQIIDNVVPLEALIAEAGAAGWRLIEFRYVPIWKTNQYCHAVFRRDCPLASPPAEPKPPLLTRVRRRLLREYDVRVARPARVRRYAEAPFLDKPDAPG